MDYIAISRNIKMSPRKVRLVADSVKKLEIPRALATLASINKRASLPIEKALKSAIANAVNNHKADKGGLELKDIIVYEGVSYKRYHYAARGRVRPYKKRTSHIKVVLVSKAGAPVVTQTPAVVNADEAPKDMTVQTKNVAAEAKTEEPKKKSRLGGLLQRGKKEEKK